MNIVLPPSVFLGNFEKLLINNRFPLGDDKVEVTSDHAWVSLHSLVGAMLKPIASKATVVLPTTVTLGNSYEVESYEDQELNRFDLSREDLILAKYVISEMSHNVFEHAQARNGAYTAISYSKKSNTLRIGVADRGIGLASSLSKTRTVVSDYDAIIQALTPGVTGTTSKEGGTAQNAGAGLFFVKSIAVWLQSHFLVYSGTGMYKLLKRKQQRIKFYSQPDMDHYSGGNDFPYWQGTAIGIDIPLGIMKNFDEVLVKIRQAYSDAIYQRVRIGKLQPQFI